MLQEEIANRQVEIIPIVAIFDCRRNTQHLPDQYLLGTTA